MPSNANIERPVGQEQSLLVLLERRRFGLRLAAVGKGSLSHHTLATFDGAPPKLV